MKTRDVSTGSQQPNEAEEARRSVSSSEKRYRLIFEHAPYCIHEVDLDGHILSMNPSGLRMLGAQSQEEVQGLDIVSLAIDDHRSLVTSAIRRARAGEAAHYEFFTENGRYLVASLVPILDGTVVDRFIGITRDVTESRQAEEDLRQAAVGLSRSMPGHSTLDLNGNFEWASEAYASMLGYPEPSELIGRHWEITVHPDDLQIAENAYRKMRAEGSVEAELRGINGNGDVVFKSILLIIRRNPGGSVIGHHCFMRDLTQQVLAEKALEESEEQLRHSQKMEAVGRLAGGVAHDFNNLLVAITGYTSLLIDETGPGETPREELLEIQRAGERAKALTRQLLTFSRKQVLEPRVLDLNRVIGDLEGMLSRLLGEDIEVITSLDPQLGLIYADPGQIEQVLVNLAVNSRDATQGGGQIRIRTAAIEPGADTTEVDGGLGCALITFSDNGEGMDDEVLARVFEPFFSTKDPDQGTGLGLATVYGIVTHSGGTVSAKSSPGKGSEFSILLPVVPAGDEEKKKPKEVERSPEGRESVLVVEDEEAVRKLTVRVLEAKGYRVSAANDGQSALLLVLARAASKTPFDLVVSDVVMPRMGGLELAERLPEVSPDTRLLLVSGYIDRGVERRLPSGQDLLQKPYSPHDLAQRVRSNLDR